jgi:hypothetical protein
VNKRFLLAAYLGLALAGASAAQTPFSGTLQCTPPSPAYTVDIPDSPGHSALLQQTSCNWTEQIQVGPTKTLQSVGVLSADVTPRKLVGGGTNVTTMGNGDMMVMTFRTVASLNNNKIPQSSQGTFTITGGTGQMSGITGTGTISGLFNTDGSATYHFQGEYVLPKPAGQ